MELITTQLGSQWGYDLWKKFLVDLVSFEGAMDKKVWQPLRSNTFNTEGLY